MEERIKEALNIAWRYGQISGDHHRLWVIDQMVQVLCGDNESYEKWVAAYEAPITEDDYYVWNCGIAP